MLHDGPLDALGRDVVDGRIAPGTAFTLDDIGRRFGVSRTVAREAMRVLESMRLITSRRRVGLVVRPADEWDVYDPRLIQWRLDGPGRDAQLHSLTELRVAVEPAAAAAAAQRSGADVGTRLVALAARLRELGEAGRLDDFLVADVEFHTLVLRASHNEMFAALGDVVAEVLAGRTKHGMMPPHPREDALAAHEALAAAIAARDSEAARAASEHIVREVTTALDDRPEG